MIARQFQVDTAFYLCCGSVLQTFREFHIVNIGVIDQKLMVGNILWHVVHRHTVGVMLVGIKIRETWGLGVQSDTTAEIQPIGYFHRHVQTGRKGEGAYFIERLHGGETGSGLDAQGMFLIIVPTEVVFHIGSNLMKSGNIREGAWASVAVGAQRMAFIFIIVTLTRVPVVFVVNTHLETLVGFAGFHIERVVHFRIEVSRF